MASVYGADPTVFHLPNSEDELPFWLIKLVAMEKSGVSFSTSRHEDGIQEFVELIKQEKAYHKSRELYNRIPGSYR
jgi:hypothetical protein